MMETTRTALIVRERLDEGWVNRVLAAAEGAPFEDRVRSGVEEAVRIAEEDPAAARAALWELRGNHAALCLIEAQLEGGPSRATFALGAAIQLFDGELSSALPNLRGCLPELLDWLEVSR